MVGDNLRGPEFPVAQFRVFMKIASPGDSFGFNLVGCCVNGLADVVLCDSGAGPQRGEYADDREEQKEAERGIFSHGSMLVFEFTLKSGACRFLLLMFSTINNLRAG
jgi:hypothetical protein